MTGSSRGPRSDVPSLSHKEAEGLISARLDTPLSDRQGQALANHLAGCDSCSSFAMAMGGMSAGFHELPRLPASPTVSRQVRERIAQPPSVWDRIGTMFGGHGAFASLASATAIVILLLGGYAIFSNSGLGGGDHDPTVAAGSQGTDVALIVDFTATLTAQTATTAPGAVLNPDAETPTIPNIRADATETPSDPTSTSDAGVGVADVKTATPVATATATMIPTKTPTVKPSATDSATAKPAATEVPSATATDKPTRTSTPEPSATERPTKKPSATEVPTDEPTATERPTKTPTETDTPQPPETDTPTLEPTQPEDTATPDESNAQPTIGPSGSTDSGDNTAIVGSGGETATVDVAAPVDETPTEVDVDPTATDDTGGGGVIEPMNTTPDTADPTEDVGVGGGTEDTTTPDSGDQTGTSNSDAGVANLDDAQTVTGLESSGGAPAGPLQINAPGTLMVLSPDQGGSDLQVVNTTEGKVVYDLGSGASPIWSPQGIVLLYQDTNHDRPEAAIYESDSGAATVISNDNGESFQEEIPAGWVDTSAYYLRVLGDSDQTVVLYAYEVNEKTTTEIWRGNGISLSSARPVALGAGFLIPTQTDWLLVGTDGSVTSLDSNTFAPTGDPILSPFGTLVMYPSDTQLVIASVQSPGSPQGALIPYAPNAGAGYSWEPNGEYVVVSDGSNLVIYDSTGNQVGEISSASGMSIAAPQWLEDGIYYVESSPDQNWRLVNSADIPGYQP